MVEDYIFGKIADSGIEKIKQWLNENKAQKILLKCFKDYSENNKDICYVDEKAILSIDSNKIKPNLRPEKVMKEIEDVFDKCICTDDSNQRKSIMLEIVYNYLKEANKDLLNLCHIDEDIHTVQDEVLENRKAIENHHNEVSKGIQDIQAALRTNTFPLLYFINELDNSRMYCYIVLKVSMKVDSDLWEEIDEVYMSGAEYSQCMVDGLWQIDVDFIEPICQYDLKQWLEAVDDIFSKNNIQIFGILTHQ